MCLIIDETLNKINENGENKFLFSDMCQLCAAFLNINTYKNYYRYDGFHQDKTLFILNYLFENLNLLRNDPEIYFTGNELVEIIFSCLY
jgi:hypothetical protein